MRALDPISELWSNGTVQCVIVADGQGVQVELRNAAGAAFLRKYAPTFQAAMNEAEYLRLLLQAGARRIRPGALKPFALVIEENRKDSEVVIEALKVAGMRAFRSPTSAEGVCVAQEVIPDLIVLDYRMRDVNGPDVCRLLRESAATAAIPIIAVTSAPDTMCRKRCLADAILAKPCRIETLVAAARLFVRYPMWDGSDPW
jgi:CheY-like chemotaxis protein